MSAIICDRASFIAWMSGVMLDRDERGRCVVGDSPLCEEAEKAARSGEEVLLSVGGRVVSRLVLRDGEVHEERKP